MKKTKRKNWILMGILAFVLMFGTMLGLGIKTPAQKIYATDNYLAGSELKIETIIGGTHSTTFAGGKYLHLDPIDKNHFTNSVSANADMEYDETTGVLKIFDTENTHDKFSRYISIIAINTTDKKLTIKAYRGIYLYVLDFPHGDLTITNGEGVHNAKLYWNNKLVITGKLTICGDIECGAVAYSNPGLYSESTSWLSADELELLDSASLWVYSSYNTYTCGVNVRYLTLNTDGFLYINANSNTNNSFTYVLYVAYEVNFTKCLYMSLYSPLDTVASITNSTYLKNAVDTAPIEGYVARIKRAKTGLYGDYGEDLYSRQLFLGRELNVSYNSNGGTGTMSSELIVYSDNLQLPACTFTAPAGKQFAGWAVGSADATPLRTPTSYIQIEEPTVIYAVWEDVPREFTSVPSNATKQVGQSYTATWTVNFDAVEYAICIWNGSAWQELYHYDANTTTAGTQMSYDITSDVAGEKRYTIDCYYDEFNCLTSDEFVITWEAAPVDELTGTVAINGNLKFGEILTANVVSNNTGTLSYQWRRNGEAIVGATNNTYTLTQDDIGYTMSVVVRSSVESGSLVGTAASIIDKADGPNAPTGITATACTTNANNNGTLVGITAEMEYKLSSSEDWTAGTGATITNLANGTYNVRYKATATHKAGASANVVVNAYNAPVQYGITVVDGGANVLSAEAGTTITITADEAPSGYVFDKWTSTDGVVFADENSATTTFNMPSKAVTITATYKLAVAPEPEAKGGLGAGAVVAIVLSSLIVASVGGFAVYWFVIKKKTWADFVALFKRK